jgi:hypothetical protein
MGADDANYRARAVYDRLARKTSWNLYELTPCNSSTATEVLPVFINHTRRGLLLRTHTPAANTRTHDESIPASVPLVVCCEGELMRV